MELLLIALVLAVIPANIAKNKGRSFFGWYIYGVLLFLIALIHSLVLKEDKKVVEENELAGGTMKKCEFCAEFIKLEAKLCRYCGKNELEKSKETLKDNLDKEKDDKV